MRPARRRPLRLASVLAGIAALAAAGPASAATPYTDKVLAAMQAVAPGLEGKAYELTQGNSLVGADGSADGWLLQTPDCWGQAACAQAPGQQRLVSSIESAVAQAETTVDITGMLPFNDGAFLDAIAGGLRTAYGAGRTPLVRVVYGWPSVNDPLGQATSAYLQALDSRLGPAAPGARIAVAQFDSSWPISWNHSKIVAVDGKIAITGGTNEWDADYISTPTPVNDVNVRVAGPASLSAHRFADQLWGYVCANTSALTTEYAATSAVAACPATSGVTAAPPVPGATTPVLGMGRLGIGVATASTKPPSTQAMLSPFGDLGADPLTTGSGLPASRGGLGFCIPWPTDYTNSSPSYDAVNPAETGLRTLIASAQSSVFITQQDLLGSCPMPVLDQRLFTIIGQRLLAGVQVTIVLSTDGSAVSGDDYSNGWSLEDLSSRILTWTAKSAPSQAVAQQAVCANLRLASLRFGPSGTWPGGALVAQHSKTVFVDGAAFYVGSENLYPAWLQEYGFLIEDPVAAATWSAEYTTPLWASSRAAAIVDASQGRCDLGAGAGAADSTPPIDDAAAGLLLGHPSAGGGAVARLPFAGPAGDPSDALDDDAPSPAAAASRRRALPERRTRRGTARVTLVVKDAAGRRVERRRATVPIVVRDHESVRALVVDLPGLTRAEVAAGARVRVGGVARIRLQGRRYVDRFAFTTRADALTRTETLDLRRPVKATGYGVADRPGRA